MYISFSRGSLPVNEERINFFLEYLIETKYRFALTVTSLYGTSDVPHYSLTDTNDVPHYASESKGSLVVSFLNRTVQSLKRNEDRSKKIKTATTNQLDIRYLEETAIIHENLTHDLCVKCQRVPPVNRCQRVMEYGKKSLFGKEWIYNLETGTSPMVLQLALFLRKVSRNTILMDDCIVVI